MIECLPCPAGSYCQYTHSSPRQCSPGTYSLQKSRGCKLCPAGFFCTGTAPPQQCDSPRQYNQFQGKDRCVKCRAGYSCQNKMEAPVECQFGYFSEEGEGRCNVCPGGFSCNAKGKRENHMRGCKKLFEYSEVGDLHCHVCPNGKICPSVEHAPISCVGGTYVSKQNRGQCLTCPAGYFCSSPEHPPFPCQIPQTYSLPGSTACMVCPENHSCQDPDVPPQPCDSKSYGVPGGKCILKEEEPQQQMERGLVTCTSPQYQDPTTSSCVNCTPGKYCNDGYYYVRDCPPGTYNTGNSLQCTLTPAGQQIANSSTGPTNCAAGSFSHQGWGYCVQCPPGYSCPNTDGTGITFCGETWGKYSTGGATTCSDCPIDRACNAFSETPCLAGQFSLLGDNFCHWCPAGKSCTKSTGTVTDCAANGQFSVYRSLTCETCPTGAVCYNNASPPSLCPYNQKPNPNQDACVNCLANQYSIGITCKTTPTGYYNQVGKFFIPNKIPYGLYSTAAGAIATCAAGYICHQGSTTSTPTTQCPPGFFCPIHATASVQFVDASPCPAGKLENLAGIRTTTCAKDCPAGKYCVDGIKQIDCPIGYYCIAGSNSPTACQNSKYTDGSGKGLLADCDSSHCPSGYYCQNGAKIMCPPGNYCDNGVKNQCSVGQYQPYQKQGSAADCKDCPPGHYCSTTQTIAPTMCPAGKYRDTVGATAEADCLNCDAGQVCPVPGNRFNDKRFPCSPGHYCLAGQKNPLNNTCNQGSYTDKTNAQNQGDCVGCPSGLLCPAGSTTLKSLNSDAKCPAGHFCNPNETPCIAGTWNPNKGATSSDSCLPCPQGFKCPEGTSSRDQFIVCDRGHYCPFGTGDTQQLPCPDGTLSPETQTIGGTTNTLWPSGIGAKSLSDCFAVHPGRAGNALCGVNRYNPFFFGFQASATADQKGCYQTPAGYSTNSQEGAIYPSPCLVGQFSAAGGDCQTCTAGYYCDQLALSQNAMLSQKQCPVGYYCINGVMNECGIGKKCAAGSSAQTDCDNGTWSFLPRSGDPCPAIIVGYYHDTTNKLAKKCPAGRYCPTTGLTADGTPCNAGQFNPTEGGDNANFCIPCPVGFHCPNTGTAQPTICPAGSYCPHGSINPTQCPAGKFNPSTGLKEESECQQCWSGHYCQNIGTVTPVACTAGYSCGRSQTTSTPTACPDNRYCVSGQIPTHCVPGKTSTSSITNIAETNCSFCPPGKYCDGKNAPQDCQAGFYCVSGASHPYGAIAAPGQFVLNAGSNAFSNCAANEYQQFAGQTSCKTCPSGYICNGNIVYDCYTDGDTNAANDNLNQVCNNSVKSSCNNGQFNSHPYGDACVACIPGYNCIFAGTLIPTFGDFLTAGGSYDGGKYGNSGTQFTSPAGYFASTAVAASTAFPCEPGTIQSVTSSTSCNPITAGTFSMGGWPNSINCPDGYQCLSTNSKSFANLCQAGYKCSSGNPRQQCKNGNYQNLKGQKDCKQCPKGYYCPDGAGAITTPTICSAGKYCAAGSASETNCLAGSYNPLQGMWSADHCLNCQPGKACLATGTATPTNCTDGKFCTISTSTEADCLAGFYCPAGSDYGTKCQSGKACIGTGNVTQGPQCNAGYFCPSGSSSQTPTGNECPTGSYCEVGSKYPKKCPPGKKNPNTQRTSLADCTDCDQYKYCDQNGSTTEAGTCAAGFFCDAGSPSKYQNQCTVGHKCENGQQIDCGDTNEYQDRTHASVCITCPNGFTCTNTTPTACDFTSNTSQNKYCTGGISVYCPDGQIIDFPRAFQVSNCINCQPGHYCQKTPAGGILKVQPCAGGKDCGWGLFSQGSDCSAGNICPAGERIKPCPAGSYCETGSATPTGQCDAGYFCPESSTIATKQNCTAGNYCPAGTDFEIPCPAGTYSNTANATANTSCLACPAGQNCDGRGLTAPNMNCLAGYFCPSGSTTQHNSICPAGNKCPANSSDATPCPVNQYQSSKGQENCLNCPAGYNCPTDTTITPTICPQGKFCAAGSAAQDCIAGTYNPRKGISQQSQCYQCPRGKYCATAGLSTPTGDCLGGHICTGNSITNNPTTGTGYQCPKGYYCPAGALKQIPCPPGRYGATAGLQAENDCTQCTAGKFCPHFAMTDVDVARPQFQCAAGHVCTGGARTEYPLSIGGSACPIGHFCVKNTSSPAQCEIGKYNPYQGQSACINCPPGFQCPNLGMSTLINCGAGHTCSGTTTGSRMPCNAGSFTAKQNLTVTGQCQDCPPGKYCLAGASTPTGDCDQGYVCALKATTNTPAGTYQPANGAVEAVSGQCPVGHFCLRGSGSPSPCQLGTYQDQIGQTSCKKCPVGKYCDQIKLSDSTTLPNCADGFLCIEGSKVNKPIDGITGRICSQGHFCQNGIQTQCVAGTYEPRKGSSNCQICPPGYHCPIGSITPTICPVNSYCPSRSEVPQLCADGTINLNTGLQNQSQCVPCPSGRFCTNGVDSGPCQAGYFCKSGSTTATPTDPDTDATNYSNGPCPSGFYCLQGTKKPTICPEGKIRSTPGGSSQSDCISCPSGYYCIQGFTVGIRCPPGMYCPPISSSQPIQCPINTYNELPQKSNLSDCLSCNNLNGSYCNTTRITDESAFQCPPGHYCIQSSQTSLLSPVICSKGTFSSDRGKQDSCTACSKGHYCQQGQIVPIRCLAGKICDLNSFRQSLCPAGNYCRDGQDGLQQCPAGFYCPQGTSIPIKCPSGTYCVAGLSTPTFCPPGSISTNNPHNIDQALGCITCDRGTYADSQSVTQCKPCQPGYVCLKETKKKYPIDRATDNGYKCPTGHYCPQGSSFQIQCPPGTYNQVQGCTSLSCCVKCDYNTYNFQSGRNGCRPCGASARSGLGQISCTCQGAHRVFQPLSGTCVCQNGYFKPAVADSSDDSTFDCVTKSRKRCKNGEIIGQNGECVGKNDCSKSCSNGIGTRVEGIGICQCSEVADVERACDRACRDDAPKVEINSESSVRITKSDGTTKIVDIFQNNKIRGQFSCPMKNCKIVNAQINQRQELAVSYHPDQTLFQTRLLEITEYNNNRSLQTSQSTSIATPIVCIKALDTFVFQVQISSTNRQNGSLYPIYDSSSILNTDGKFDNSPFKNLENRIKFTNQDITHFAYQFNYAGIFVFTSSLQQSKYMIVRVMRPQQSCPNSDQYIQPITQQSLRALGLKVERRLPDDTNWGLLTGMLFVFIIILGIFFLFIAYFHSKHIVRDKQILLQVGNSNEFTQISAEKSIGEVLFGPKCYRKRAKVKPMENNKKLQLETSKSKKIKSKRLGKNCYTSSIMEQDDMAETKKQNEFFDIESLIHDLKEDQNMNLSLEDITQLKNLSKKLQTQVNNFMQRKSQAYQDIKSKAKIINYRLTKISQKNELKPPIVNKQQEQRQFANKKWSEIQLDNPQSDEEEQEMIVFITKNHQASSQNSRNSRSQSTSLGTDQIQNNNNNNTINNNLAKESNEIRSNLKSEYQKRCANLEQEVISKQALHFQNERISLGNKLSQTCDEDGVMLFSDCQYHETLKQHQEIIAKIGNLVKIESERMETSLESKVINQREILFRIFEQRIKVENSFKVKLHQQYIESIQNVRKKAQQDLKKLSNPEGLKKAMLKDLNKRIEKEKLDYIDTKKDQINEKLKLKKNLSEVQVKAILKSHDNAQIKKFQQLDNQLAQQSANIQENMQELIQQKLDERKLMYRQEKARLQHQHQLNLRQNQYEIEELKIFLNNNQLNERINQFQALAEQEQKIAAFELSKDYQKEIVQSTQRINAIINKIDTKLFEQLGINASTPQTIHQCSEIRAKLIHITQQRNIASHQLQKLQEQQEISLDSRYRIAKLLRSDSLLCSVKQEQKTLKQRKIQIQSDIKLFDQDINNMEKRISQIQERDQQHFLRRKQMYSMKNKSRLDSYMKNQQKFKIMAKQEMVDRQEVIQTQLQEQLQTIVQEFQNSKRFDQDNDENNRNIFYMVNNVVDLNHSAEMSNVIAVLLNERIDGIKNLTERLFMDKLDELTLLKEEFYPKFRLLLSDRANGVFDKKCFDDTIIDQQSKNLDDDSDDVSAAQFQKQWKEIQNQEHERKKDVDIKFFEELKREEDQLAAQFDKKEVELLIALRIRQFEVKNQIMKRFIPKQNKKLKMYELQRREILNGQLERFKTQINYSINERAANNEAEKNELQEILVSSSSHQREVEIIKQKQEIERQRREKKLLEENKKQIEQKRNAIMKQIQQRQHVEGHIKKELLQQYEKEIISLNTAEFSERKRQSEMLTKKVNQRKKMKMIQLQEKQRKLALYKMHQEKLLQKRVGQILLKENKDINLQAQFFLTNSFRMIENYEQNVKLFQKLQFPNKLIIIKESEEQNEEIERKNKIRRNLQNVHHLSSSSSSLIKYASMNNRKLKAMTPLRFEYANRLSNENSPTMQGSPANFSNALTKLAMKEKSSNNNTGKIQEIMNKLSTIENILNEQ